MRADDDASHGLALDKVLNPPDILHPDRSFEDNLDACYSGVKKNVINVIFGVLGKQAWGTITEKESLIRVSADNFVYGIFIACWIGEEHW